MAEKNQGGTAIATSVLVAQRVALELWPSNTPFAMSQCGRGRPKKRARNLSGLRNQGPRPVSAPLAVNLLDMIPDSLPTSINSCKITLLKFFSVLGLVQVPLSIGGSQQLCWSKGCCSEIAWCMPCGCHLSLHQPILEMYRCTLQGFISRCSSMGSKKAEGSQSCVRAGNERSWSLQFKAGMVVTQTHCKVRRNRAKIWPSPKYR
jgi:hypothetical protein